MDTPTHFLRLAAIAVLLPFSASQVVGQTDFTFTAGSGAWDNAGNWDQASFPNGTNDNVIFGSGNTVNALNSDVTVRDFTTGGSLTFQNINNRLITINGAINHTSGTIAVQGSIGLILNGTSSISGALQLTNGAGLQNNGNITFASNASFSRSVDPEEAHTPRFGSYQIVNSSGASATFNNNGDVSLNNFVVNNAGNMVVNFATPGRSITVGTLDQASTGTTVVHANSTLSSNSMNLLQGTLYNAGTINGSNLRLGDGSTGVTVSAGNAADTVGTGTFTGNLQDVADSTWLFDLGGTTAGTGFDVLAFSDFQGGSIDDVTLDLNLINGFTPEASDSFTIVTNGLNSIAGTFSNVVDDSVTIAGVGTFDVSMDLAGAGGNEVRSITLSNFAAVPEPSAAAVLFGLGALGLAATRRRQRAV